MRGSVAAELVFVAVAVVLASRSGTLLAAVAEDAASVAAVVALRLRQERPLGLHSRGSLVYRHVSVQIMDPVLQIIQLDGEDADEEVVVESSHEADHNDGGVYPRAAGRSSRI